MVEERLRKRALELIELGGQLALEGRRGAENYAPLHEGRLQEWMTSSLALVELIVPSPLSPYRTRAAQALTAYSLYSEGRAERLSGVLRALLADIDAGLLTSVVDSTRAETFDDLLDHAEHYLRANRKEPAGVLAGVVFEDTVRRACERRSIAQTGVQLDQLITALEKATAISAIEAKRARAAAAVRTQATHAQWDQFSKNDVEDTIRFSRQMLEKLLA